MGPYKLQSPHPYFHPGVYTPTQKKECFSALELKKATTGPEVPNKKADLRTNPWKWYT